MTARRVPAFASGILLVVAVLFLMLGTLSAAPVSQRPGGTPDPLLVCTWSFRDDFPLDGAQIEGDRATVSVGAEPYTAAYAGGTNGVRIRNFEDPLRVKDRPGRADYEDRGAWDVGRAWGFTVTGADDGVHVGGVAGCPGDCGEHHANSASLSHTLPRSQHDPDTAYFLATFNMRVDQSEGIPNDNSGNAGLHVSGISSMPERPNHRVYMTGEFGNAPVRARSVFVDGTKAEVMWSSLENLNPPRWPDVPVSLGQVYPWLMRLRPDQIMAVFNGGHAEYDGFQPSLSSLESVSLGASVRYGGTALRVVFSDFKFEWLASGIVTSTAISLPPQHTFYRTFAATDEIDNGAIDYHVVDAKGRDVSIQSGADLSEITPALVAPIRLEALLRRSALEANSPILREWKVETCYRRLGTLTPSPTRTPSTQTPTPTNTQPPPPTQRPTSTPLPYFQMAPLAPAVHLKVDSVLDPPAWPLDETDWREIDPIWYPLQVYAGLVPFAYVDTESGNPPPQLCYWGSGKWHCVPGTVHLGAYTLREIEMDGIVYYDDPITVPYARDHRLRRWNRSEYQYDAEEYTWVNWLAPGGVDPECGSRSRCVNVRGVTGGVSFITYDVTGNIHWEAIPGVGGPYDYTFSNRYRVPISLWYPRAEP